MADNFDLKKYLVENKLGPFSKVKQLNEEASPEIIETTAFDNATWKKTGKTKSFSVLNADGYQIDSYTADGVEVDNKALRIREGREVTIKEGFVFVQSIGSQEMTMTSRSAYVTRPGNLYRATTDVTSPTSFEVGDKVKFEGEDGWVITKLPDGIGRRVVDIEKNGVKKSTLFSALNYENQPERINFDEYSQQKTN